jgi:hypothetical protein
LPIEPDAYVKPNEDDLEMYVYWFYQATKILTTIDSLVQSLDSHLHDTSRPVDVAAKDDRELLKFNAARLLSSWRIVQASNVIDNTTLLLRLIYDAQSDKARRQQAAIKYGFKDEIDVEKYLANLEHIVSSLQQAALQALVQHSLNVLESDCRHWDRYLEKLKRCFEDWFSEWAGGRPPLVTTMPWTIKPSLVVLWGVCWMFYMTNASPSQSGQPGEDAWIQQQPWIQRNIQSNIQSSVQNIGKAFFFLKL